MHQSRIDFMPAMLSCVSKQVQRRWRTRAKPGGETERILAIYLFQENVPSVPLFLPREGHPAGTFMRSLPVRECPRTVGAGFNERDVKKSRVLLNRSENLFVTVASSAIEERTTIVDSRVVRKVGKNDPSGTPKALTETPPRANVSPVNAQSGR